MTKTIVAAAVGLAALSGRSADAPTLVLSHAWIVVAPGAPERGALEAAGFRIAPTVNRHDGQGTASVTVELLNGFLELIYPDPGVPVSPELERGAEKFQQKSRWRQTGTSPFGLVFDRTASTPDAFPFPTWKVTADWMAKGTAIEMMTPREMLQAVSLSVSSQPVGVRQTESDSERIAQDPVKGWMFLHPNGARRLTACRVVAPAMDRFPPAAEYLAERHLARFEAGAEWLLDVTLDGGRQGVARDLRPVLPLVIRY